MPSEVRHLECPPCYYLLSNTRNPAPQNANQVSTIRLRMRDVDPNEQLTGARDLHLLFQETSRRDPCACANGLRVRPGHQINAGLIGHSQVGVILYIEAVS